MSTDPLAARLLAIFRSEMDELLRALNADLLSLEADPRDTERLGSLFRIVHTLKGAAHAAHVSQVESVCHTLESFLVEVREGRRKLDSGAFSLLFSSADELAEASDRLRKGSDLEGSSIPSQEHGLRTSPPEPEAIAAQPTADAGSPGAEEAPGALLGRELDGAAAPAGRATAPSQDPGHEQVRVTAEKLDSLAAVAGQLLITTGRVNGRPAELEELCDLVGRWQGTWGRAARRLRVVAQEASVPPALLQRLDEMQHHLRHVGHETSRLAAAVRADAHALSLVAGEFGGRVRRLRLSPFSDACVALPRAVRDLAAESGKEVRLEIVGQDIEADRAVLDVLQEVLLQLVRNAIDHGIEPPEARERGGKPRYGTITVSAALRGSRLVITVADDGGGPDLEAIRGQLRRQGATLPVPDEEIARTLFQSGFSTREKATAISGRGVGLDVVRTTIERIRGSVQVRWVEGKGTSFELECPPTLATVRAVLAALGPEIVAIPSAHVEHLARVSSTEIRRVNGRDVIVTPVAPTPLVSLARLLGPPLSEQVVSGPLTVIRLLVGSRRLAVTVDEVLAEEEIVVRPLERIGRLPPFVSGAAVLATGRVALVLNAAAVVAEGNEQKVRGPSLGAVPAAAPARKRILVVDDSITTRTLEQSILEAAGYKVLTAVDGMDAWQMLQEQTCDLVVSDVEMPRMDGFQLCESIRASARLSGLPAILVTALDTPADQARGMEVGADAYLPKSSFDQQDLLDTIQQLLG